MRLFFVLLLFITCMLYAQVGIARNMHGIRVPSAYTLEQGFIYFSLNFETISDGEPLALDGFTNELNKKTVIKDKTAASSSGFQINYGLFDFLELGISLPMYYESEVSGTELKGFGIGDIQNSIKIRIPLNIPLYIAFEGDVFIPTGTKSLGFRPRHLWYIKQNKPSYAYTSNEISLAGNTFITFNFFDILLWNNYIGYLTTINENNDVLLWGLGFELFPNKMISLITDISLEISIDNKKNKFINHPLKLSPGLRLHLPHYTDILIGADIGIDFFRGRNPKNGLEVTRKNNDNIITYKIPGTHELSFVFSLTKTLNLSSKDSDQDGIVDRLDMCPNTTFGVTVNNRGCPVDEDQDGVLNIVDDCPGTSFGISVDFFGCPLDDDKDGIPNYIDKCPQTPYGKAVNNEGCILDSDEDGIDDNHDLCKDTPRNEVVGANGCPIDNDKDGVLNEFDLCENTPLGRSVDQNGCPLDFDKDGIPDDIDQCPNSLPNEIVDAKGCPLDEDKDGVPDSKDICPDTPNGFSVDQNGCPTDTDKDDVPDNLDKCPNTPPKAPVDSNGCPIDSDNDGIADYLDKCPNTFPNVFVNKEGCPYNHKMNLNILSKQFKFQNNTEKPQNSSFTVINDIIELLRKYDFKLKIEVSANGNHAKIISEKRAEYIGQIFEIKGFNQEKIEIIAVGDAFPSGIKLTPIDIKR